MPTVRNQPVTPFPVAGDGMVTRTSDPMCAPTSAMVLAPSATSSSAPGGRPAMMVSRLWPRMSCAAMPSTAFPLMVTGPPRPAVIAVMPGRRSAASSCWLWSATPCR